MSEGLSDAIWWRVNSKLETKSIYLFGFVLSPRQLIIALVSLLVGYLFSIPAPGNINGIPFLGKLIVIGIFMCSGFLISSRRIKMVPVELLILYRLTASQGERSKAPTQKPESKGERREEDVEMIFVDDFMHPLPYSVDGKLAVQRRAKLSFFIDDQLIADDYVSPARSRYRFVYVPRPEHIGTHELVLRVEGEREPLFRKTIGIVPRGKEITLETKK